MDKITRKFTALPAGLISIFDPAAIIDRALFSFRCVEDLSAHGIAALAHLAVTVTLTAVRTAAADQIIFVTHL